MKTFLFVALLIFSSVAQATHHRGHAVAQLDDALRFSNLSIGIAERNRDDPDTPELAAFHLNKYVIYQGKYRNRIVAARELLLTGGDLMEVRRLISAPGSDGEKESADYGTASTVSIIAAAIREGADPYQMSMLLTRHSKSHQFLGWGHWHAIDAILEEVEGNPEFACNGPGNHCE